MKKYTGFNGGIKMKKKTTKQFINSFFSNVIKVSYCDLQYLLSYEQPFGYNDGVFGWNWDAYNLYGVIIVTGYRNLVGRQADGVAEYESKAKSIIQNCGISESERREQINKLLREFCKINGGF